MRHFPTQSGKSKGQFYTPAEVSIIMGSVIQIEQSTSQTQTLHDPTCSTMRPALFAPRTAAGASPHPGETAA